MLRWHGALLQNPPLWCIVRVLERRELPLHVGPHRTPAATLLFQFRDARENEAVVESGADEAKERKREQIGEREREKKDGERERESGEGGRRSVSACMPAPCVQGSVWRGEQRPLRLPSPPDPPRPPLGEREREMERDGKRENASEGGVPKHKQTNAPVAAAQERH